MVAESTESLSFCYKIPHSCHRFNNLSWLKRNSLTSICWLALFLNCDLKWFRVWCFLAYHKQLYLYLQLCLIIQFLGISINIGSLIWFYNPSNFVTEKSWLFQRCYTIDVFLAGSVSHSLSMWLKYSLAINKNNPCCKEWGGLTNYLYADLIVVWPLEEIFLICPSIGGKNATWSFVFFFCISSHT